MSGSEVRRVVDQLNHEIWCNVPSNQEYTLLLELDVINEEYIKFAGRYVWANGQFCRGASFVGEELKAYLWTQMSLIKHSIYKAMLAVEKNLDNKEL